MADANFQVKKGLTVPKGSESEPSIIFTAADSNTGIYSPAENQVSVATAGSEVVRVNSSGQIQAVSSGSAAAPIYTFAEDNDTGVYSYGPNGLALTTNGQGAVYVNSFQRVGIQEPNPLRSLHVKSDLAEYARFQTTVSGVGAGYITFYDESSRKWFIGNSSTTNSIVRLINDVDDRSLLIGDDIDFRNGSDVTFSLTSTDQLSHIGNGSEASPAVSFNGSAPANTFVLDSNGRALFNTATSVPIAGYTATTLQVHGIGGPSAGASRLASVRWHDTTGPAGISIAKSRSEVPGTYTIVNAGDTIGRLDFIGDDGVDLNHPAARIDVEVDGTPTANSIPGRLIFSTTTSGDSFPTERLRIDDQGQLLLVTENSCLDVATVQASGTSNYLFQGRYSATAGSPSTGTISFKVTSNGDVTNANNSYGPISSDERLKQDIVDADSQWDDIKAVRLTKFHYKNDPTGELHLGPIAQELEQVSPGLITRRPVFEEEVADPSNDLVDGDEVLSFKASILYMKAVGALQEAMKRIETLESKVADFEAL